MTISFYAFGIFGLWFKGPALKLPEDTFKFYYFKVVYILYLSL